MRALRIQVGQRFGRLVVLDPEVRKQTQSVPRGRRAVLCLCDCGTQTVVSPSGLVRGGTVSCGCAQREAVADRNRSHGLTGHPLYVVHWGMMQRCYNEGHPAFHRYAGRDIGVCERWHDVRLFIADIEREIGPRPEGRYENGRVMYEIDRIDNDGNYEPGNVRWATRSEQGLNTRPHLEAVRRGTQRRTGLPVRLVPRHLRNHALQAIAQRLQGATPAECALLAVERDQDAMIIRVNSGGNALAVESYLRWHGYCAEYAGSNPDGYGCAVRVSLRGPAVSAIGKALAAMKDNPGLPVAEVAERAGVSVNVARKARGRLAGSQGNPSGQPRPARPQRTGAAEVTPPPATLPHMRRQAP